MKENAYMVYCEPRVVLFGYATEEEIDKEHPMLKRARMLVYWDRGTRGVLGAASKGPTDGCRVTPAVPEHTIKTKVEGYSLCSPEAVERWESEPWG